MVIEWTSDEIRPSLSPDGRKIAFYSNKLQQNKKKFDLWVANVDGGGAKKLDSDVIVADVNGPVWLPEMISCSRETISRRTTRLSEMVPQVVCWRQIRSLIDLTCMCRHPVYDWRYGHGLRGPIERHGVRSSSWTLIVIAKVRECRDDPTKVYSIDIGYFGRPDARRSCIRSGQRVGCWWLHSARASGNLRPSPSILP